LRDVTEQVSEQGKFAASAFVVRYEREVGCSLPVAVVYHVRFAFELGHLRGHGDGLLAASQMLQQQRKADDVAERAKSAADVFVERYGREVGCSLPVAVVYHVHFAFEMGYLGGHGDGLLAASQLAQQQRKIDDESE
jgi:hypothetical protein